MLLEVLLLVLLPPVLVVVAAVFLARRPSVAGGDLDSDTVSFSGGVLSALFTVVLAFHIVFAWQAGADVESAATAEANAALDLHWRAADLSPPVRDEVRGLVRTYTALVVDAEWGALARGGTDPRPPETLRRLRGVLAALPADGGAVESARDAALHDVRQLDENRRARVDLATGGDTFAAVLLVGTVIGAAFMIGFPLLVGISATPGNLVVLAALTLTVGATVFLSVQLARPLDGPFGVGPAAHLAALDEMLPRS